MRLLHEDRRWLGHINASPTEADWLTFCQEGPWTRLQRLWALRISTGEVRALRPQEPGEAIGHEYWFADGKRVGYHGWLNPEQHLFGYVDWETGERREWPWSGRSMHFHSMDDQFIVGDGVRGERPQLLAWQIDGESYAGPRVLMDHRGSFHAQELHPHPRVHRGPEGQLRVLLTADPQAYGQVFLVDVPEFEALPEAT
jgi:oligogalacturonide lyase